MVWNVVVRFFVVVLVGCGNWSACYCSSDFCARPILTADFLWIFFVSCGVCIGSDFWRPRRVYCSAWVGVPATPGVPLSHKTKRSNPTSALIRPTLTKLAHCDCIVKKEATHQDIFEGDVVVGELDKFLSCDGGVGSHLGFVDRYLHRKHQKKYCLLICIGEIQVWQQIQIQIQIPSSWQGDRQRPTAAAET